MRVGAQIAGTRPRRRQLRLHPAVDAVGPEGRDASPLNFCRAGSRPSSRPTRSAAVTLQQAAEPIELSFALGDELIALLAQLAQVVVAGIVQRFAREVERSLKSHVPIAE
jgi:hypothetical protein